MRERKQTIIAKITEEFEFYFSIHEFLRILKFSQILKIKSGY